MATVTEIKSRIDLLDQSKFQQLTDIIIKMENPSGSIISYGINIKGRTIKGTPDSFVLKPDSTIFVETTIQKSRLYKKFDADVRKCLSLSSKALNKIILSYTGRLNVKEIEKLQELLPANITLEILGIDEIAHLIYFKYQYLAKDYLDLSVDSGQIIPINAYLENVDKNQYTAPLNVNFMFREKDMIEIKEGLEIADYVILSGVQGCGKTRLALEILEQESTRISYIIKNKNVAIHEDLNRYFQIGNRYLILIDDANQLSQFRSMIEHFSMFFNPGDIKVIITVRDYAKNNIMSQLDNVPFKRIKIGLFTDEEIANIIKNNLQILNHDYLNQISRVSKGNARIAYQIGLTAIKENKLSSIHNNEEVMTLFYRKIIEMISENKNHVIGFGIMSFIGKLKFSDKHELERVSYLANLSTDELIDAISFLHANELIDIYDQNIAMISDETMGNYIFYYVFIEKKVLDIAKFITEYYKTHLKRVISVINASLSIFLISSKIVFEESTLKIFKELINVSKEDALDFSVHFGSLFELESLLFLQSITNAIANKGEIEIIDSEFDYTKKTITNPILLALKLLSDGEYFNEIFELLILLLQKDGFRAEEVVAAIYQSFKLEKQCLNGEFAVQKTILDKLTTDSKSQNSKILLQILIQNYIPLGFEETTFKGRTFEIYSVVYNDQSYNYDFRKKIWEYTNRYINENYKKKIIKLFLDSKWIYNVSENIMVNEFNLINEYLFDIVSKSPAVITRMNNIAKYYSITDNELEKLSNSRNVYIYLLLHQGHFGIRDNPDDYNEKNIKLLIKFAQEIDESDYQLLTSLIIGNKYEEYKVGESLRIILQNVENKYFYKLLDAFLLSDTHLLFYPGNIIDRIIKSGVEYLDFINQYDHFSYKNNWILQYYENLDASEVDEKTLKDFLKFLGSYNVTGTYSYIRVEKLIKYFKLNRNFYVIYSKIALGKDINTFYSFTSLLFNEHLVKPYELFTYLNEDIELYEKLYYKSYQSDSNFDYNGIYIRFMCDMDIDTIYDYYKIILSENGLHMRESTLDFVWELDNSEVIVNHLIDMSVESNVNNPFRSLFNNSLALLKSKNYLLKYVEILKKRLAKTNNPVEVAVISEVGLDLGEQKMSLFESFINANRDFDQFKNYAIIPSMSSWSGSAIPHINNQIKQINRFIEKIPHTSDYLQHRKYLQQFIDSKINERNYWEEQEIFDEYLG